MMWEQSLSHHKQDNVIIPLPSTTGEIGGPEEVAMDNAQYSIFSCFTESVAADGEVMNNLKSSQAHQCFHSNEVWCVLLQEVEENLIYLKADIKLETQSPTSHHRYGAREEKNCFVLTM